MNTTLLTLAQKPALNPRDFAELEGYEYYTLTPIEHDYAGKTPKMWNSLYRSFGFQIIGAMVVCDSQKAEAVVQAFRVDQKYIGGGAGVGFKDELPKFLDELDPLAEAVQSVNVIKKMPSGKLRGYNTDGLGYRESLLQLMTVRGKKPEQSEIVILGAGGTGNAVAFALAEKFREVVILNRSVDKAKVLAEKVNSYVGKSVCRFGGEELILDEIKTADVILNVSTKGATGSLELYSALAPAVLPATKENVRTNLSKSKIVFAAVRPGTIVSDIVLRNDDSPFLAQAKKLGFTTLDGVPMVLNQGVEAFWIVHEAELKQKGITKTEVKKVVMSIV